MQKKVHNKPNNCIKSGYYKKSVEIISYDFTKPKGEAQIEKKQKQNKDKKNNSMWYQTGNHIRSFV